MNVAETRPLELLYEGSVKRVWQANKKADRLWFEFTDDYSVFDWGKMPDTIANKGRALTIMGAHLFDKLAKPEFWQALPQSPHLLKFDPTWLNQRFQHPVYSGATGLRVAGAPTHFRALTQYDDVVKDASAAAAAPDPLYMEVLAAQVHRPSLHKIGHHSLYFYNQGIALAQAQPAPLRLVPLEIVFRFGMPGGSSLVERLQREPDYAAELGLTNPKAGQLFSHPVIEFYTKLEPKDRLLSWQEAGALAAMSGPEFEAMVELALDTALALHSIFADKQIDLWDGKLEMVARGDQLLLADSIGPDELRLLHQGCHLSKEMIRQLYRGTPWEKSLKEAQRLAKLDNSRSWKEIAVDELHAAPQALPPQFKQLVDKLYPVICNHLLGDQIFNNQPTLEQFVASLPANLIGDVSEVASSKSAPPPPDTLLPGTARIED